ncbi:uncharacterized protein L203_103023 [Cryptococcus depauperatus CBS 7841]|uniref:Uncharacterized protein n=1 Tax=Cryptococcus depauperatus CBS 7841 TaxID=1295531 RepID=A0A1E3IPR9_9TREE|nr:hypothetical protein L203_01708 [Cryptococcus depauperatus CBS 7841]
MVSSSLSRSTTKKSGKENVPARGHSKALVDDMDDGNTETSQDEAPPSTKQKTKRSLQEVSEDMVAPKDLKRKLGAMTAERDRLITQRDTFSKQFEELSRLRSSEAEGLLEKYKQKAELHAKTQNDIIASQTALMEKLQAKVQQLEKSLAAAREASLSSASGPIESNEKPNPKEIKVLKDELAKVKSESMAKDEKIINLEREYKAEVEHSRSLQASSKIPASAPTTTALSNTPEEAEKDAASLGLYEDLTLLNIANVKIKPGRYGKERTFNCVMSVNGQSLNFKLRCYTEVDKTNVKDPYTKLVHYTPELLQHEPEAFVQKLDYFGKEFVVARDQLAGFFVELRAKMGEEEE